MKGSLPDLAKGYMSGNVFDGREDLTRDNYAALDFKRWLTPPTASSRLSTVSYPRHFQPRKLLAPRSIIKKPRRTISSAGAFVSARHQ